MQALTSRHIQWTVEHHSTRRVKAVYNKAQGGSVFCIVCSGRCSVPDVQCSLRIGDTDELMLAIFCAPGTLLCTRNPI